jgi:hypothetical protein
MTPITAAANNDFLMFILQNFPTKGECDARSFVPAKYCPFSGTFLLTAKAGAVGHFISFRDGLSEVTEGKWSA